jgi:tetratricopeptide (TPR) repeat protein
VGAGVSEETEGQDTGAEAVAGGVDPFAAAMALGGAGRETADAFLNDQRALIADQRAMIADQRHHLHEQFKHLHLSVWEKQLGVLLRAATVVVGIGFAAAITFVIWDAAHSDGLVIEAFSVPPDLAQRGMTGQVVAAEFLDHLSQMQTETNSARAAKSYANNWSGQDIKLDIPEAGVSLVALDDFLREKLGHDTHITGEIVRTASGLSLIVRAGRSGAESVTGSEADVTGLVAKSAEAIYRLTQPYRYAHLLADTGHVPDAIALDKELMKTGSKLDRMWAYATVGYLTDGIDGLDAGLRILRRAVAEEPNNILGWRMIGQESNSKSHPEEALHAFQNALLHLSDKAQENYSPALVPLEQKQLQAQISDELGAFHDAAQVWTDFVRNPIPGDTASAYSGYLAISKVGEHDLATARAADIGSAGIYVVWTRMRIDSEAQNWAAVLSQADAVAALIQESPGYRSWYPSLFAPLVAYAEARLGKIADAQKHIAATPADCYDCLITRARIAELQGQHPRADWWFARAIDGQKSIPFAYAYWGQALMERGDLNGAIAKFTTANQKGPHFADPLEMWGETLMLQKHPDQALAKFEEADQYAPNWGQLHLKWGEALVYAGKKDEAKAQFARAAGLDLTPTEKVELARHP